MANPDRASGFRPVGTLSGAPWQGLIRRLLVADNSADSTNNHGDIYIGDPIKVDASGLALLYEQADNDCLGVAVGFGVVPAGESANESGMFNPADLEKRYANAADSANANVFVYYVPAEDVIFEVQTDVAITLQVSDNLDISEVANTAHGSRTTSLSSMEATTDTSADLRIVHLPEYVDNDTTAANARVHVVFADTEFGAAT